MTGSTSRREPAPFDPEERRRIQITLLAIVYYVIAGFGLSHATLDPSVSAVWPPTGVALAALLICGENLWPGVFLGAFLINLHVNLSKHALGVPTSILAALAMATGNTLEAVIGAALTRRFAHGRRALERAADVFKMALAAGLLSTIASATVGALVLALTGASPWPHFAPVWLTWWMGDAAGSLIYAPLLLAWTSEPAPGPGRPVLEAVGVTFLLAASTWGAFGPHQHPFAFPLIPALLWAAYSFGVRGATTAALFLCLTTTWATTRGQGPFVAMGRENSLLFLQTYLAMISITANALAASISERRRAEAELLRSNERLEAEVERRTRELVQAQKMEAVGRLAGSIAHEFNNVLTGIMGLAGLIKQETPAGQAAVADAESIMSACRRGAALVSRLLTFSRRRESAKAALDLNAAISSARKMLEVSLGDGISLDVSLGAETPAVQAVADHLEQVLLNLCLNARDAMSGSGRITLTTHLERVLAPTTLSHGSVAAGDYAVLSVADGGAGISAEHQKRIFEPFFSTKNVGEGSGLGLSVVYGIVTDHKGAVDVSTRPGRTEFRIYLPATTEKPAPAAAPEGLRGPLRGTETLLVADDDLLVRELLARVLGRQGYSVLVASDGEEALRLLSENAERVALALLDITMPKLRGDEVYARIESRRPGTKVLFMTGNASAALEETLRSRRLPLLPKPFTQEDVVSRVRELLDR